MGFGDYPKEYNPSTHGPYDPARFYGNPDTPFGQVKIGDLGAWFSRRQKSPQAMAGAVSRAFWRWQHKFVQPRRCGATPIYQAVAVCVIFSYVINYDRNIEHKVAKYH